MRYKIYPTSEKNGLGFLWGFGSFLMLLGIAAVYIEISSNGGLMTLINNGSLWEVLINGSSLGFAATFCFFGLIFLVPAIGITIEHKKK